MSSSWNVRGKFKSSIQIEAVRKKVARINWNDTIASIATVNAGEDVSGSRYG
jgi:hypothetical protein